MQMMADGFVVRIIKDPGSAITHFIAFVATLLAAAPLLVRTAAACGQGAATRGMGIFLASMLLLYGASAAYHTFDISGRGNRILQKIDHIMIYVLIAGTYTPVCLITLQGKTGTRLLILVWAVAAAGVVMNSLWIRCPKWLSSVIYIGMGWLCVLVMGQLWEALSFPAFGWLLAGGLFYTAGGVIYALRKPAFELRHPHFGMHEIFHLFVMAGSFCHYIVMFFFLI